MTCIRAWNHHPGDSTEGDMDNYVTMDSRRGRCDICDVNKGYALFGKHCTDCNHYIAEAKKLPV